MADQLIKFDIVDGESQQKEYEKWIEISGFSVSSATPGSTLVGGGSGVGKPSIHGINFSTVAGKHTPKIMKNYFEGKHFDEVKVVFVKQSGKDSVEKFYEMTMKHVFITSMSLSKSEGSLGHESLTATAEEYKQEYFEQNAQGIIQSIGSSTYNEKTGKSS